MIAFKNLKTFFKKKLPKTTGNPIQKPYDVH